MGALEFIRLMDGLCRVGWLLIPVIVVWALCVMIALVKMKQMMAAIVMNLISFKVFAL
jgi:hypothetical protein